MKLFKSASQNNLLISSAALIVTFVLSGCGRTVEFLPSTVVPMAKGKISIKQDKNENYAIDLNVQNLADPGQLPTPKGSYVVWAETEDNGTVNLGRLENSKGLFSKSSKGSLETVTPYQPRIFIITAEDRSDVQYPSSDIVMKSQDFRPKF